MKKNILVVDDSALMRRVVCDIINSDDRFQVVDTAKNGVEALTLLMDKQYDAVVLDINMPRMSGLELLEQLQKYKIKARVIMNSTLTKQGAKETIYALELGALDFVTKPENFIEAKGNAFRENLLTVLAVAAKADYTRTRTSTFLQRENEELQPAYRRPTFLSSGNKERPTAEERLSGKSKIVALACSTGGPKSLQSIIPKLPKNLNAPILLVQHMPAGFTRSLAERLNEMSEIEVKEAAEGDIIQKGVVYIAPGGKHMKAVKTKGVHRIMLTEDPPSEGVRPCANYMYYSLKECDYDEVICVVLTGMGADGTKGIRDLDTKKKIYVIAQDEATSVVYGMPKAIAETGIVDEILPLQRVSEAITRNTGV